MDLMTRSFSLAVVPGDGIGPEGTAQALRVLDLVAADHDAAFSSTEYDLGAKRWHATGETLPDSVLEEIRGHDAILLGAVGDPSVPSGCLGRTPPPARSRWVPGATPASRPASSSAACCSSCGSPSTTTSTCGPPSSF